MTIFTPEATPSFAASKLTLITAIANMASPSLASEINAVSSLEVTMAILAPGFRARFASNAATQPRRQGQRVVLPGRGSANLEPITVQYTHDPQGSSSVDANKAKTFLVAGTIFYFLERRGPHVETVAYAAAQRARTWKFEADIQNEIESSDDEGAVYVIEQNWYPKLLPVDAIIAA